MNFSNIIFACLFLSDPLIPKQSVAAQCHNLLSWRQHVTQMYVNIVSYYSLHIKGTNIKNITKSFDHRGIPAAQHIHAACLKDFQAFNLSQRFVLLLQDLLHIKSNKFFFEETRITQQKMWWVWRVGFSYGCRVTGHNWCSSCLTQSSVMEEIIPQQA